MNRTTLNLMRLRATFAQEPLAILASAIPDIVGRIRDGWDETRSASEFLAEPSAEAVEAYYAARPGGNRSGTVAVVPVLGPISKRDSLMSMMLGGTSTTRLVAQLRQLAADESVATILLNVDSPGGTVSGLPELAAEIRKARESKNVVTIVNDVAASAAYWVASQADSIVATPESLTGSVGVFVQHADCSKAMDEAGVQMSFIHAGRYKVEGNPYEPLSDEAREHIQSIVDSAYGLFVSDVAKGRNVTPAQVRDDFGEGRVLTAKDALKAGMVDRVATYSETVARLSGVKPMGARADAAAWEDALSDPTTRGALDQGLAEVAAGETVTLGFDGTAGDEPETSTSGATAVITGPLPRTRVWRGRSRRR